MRIALTIIAFTLISISTYTYAQGQAVKSPPVQHSVINDQPAGPLEKGFTYATPKLTTLISGI